VVLVVNVASKCGLTPQYAALEKLQQQFKGKGFNVLGLPCNQFAGQEPGSEEEIQEFCSLNYGVSFPLSEQARSQRLERHQLYRLLAGEGAEFPGDITWNFEKFLVGKDGRVLARFAPRTAPDDPTVAGDRESVGLRAGLPEAALTRSRSITAINNAVPGMITPISCPRKLTPPGAPHVQQPSVPPSTLAPSTCRPAWSWRR
jgi:glutathione peroxidase